MLLPLKQKYFPIGRLMLVKFATHPLLTYSFPVVYESKKFPRSFRKNSLSEKIFRYASQTIISQLDVGVELGGNFPIFDGLFVIFHLFGREFWELGVVGTEKYVGTFFFY